MNPTALPGSASMEKVMSHVDATFAGDDPYFAPISISDSHLLAVLFQTVTSHPALIRLRAIGEPIIPRPRKPMRVDDFSLPTTPSVDMLTVQHG